MPEELSGILPRILKPFLFPIVNQQIISDWLIWECLRNAEEVYPLLREIAGWRRHEVMDYCNSQRDIWSAHIAESYGYPGAVS